jgi:UDP-glucose 4-epimerase
VTAPGVAAVTGGSGFLGRALVARLAADQPVRVLARREGRWTGWCREAGIDVVLGDLADPGALVRLVREAEVVYHCAAFMGKRNPAASVAVNVEGTRRVARAAARADVGRFVSVSSISVFGATRAPGDTITEQIAPAHIDRLNHYARTKYLGECAVRDVARETGLSSVIVRPTNVYGPDAGPWFHQYARLVRRLPVALGSVPIDLVFVDDVVAALLLAGRSPAAAGEVFHLGHEMVPLRTFVTAVAAVVGRRVRLLPGPVDRTVCALIDRGFRAATGTHMSLSLARAVSYPHLHAWLVLGYEPRVRLAEGFARIRRWYHGGPDADGLPPTDPRPSAARAASGRDA